MSELGIALIAAGAAIAGSAATGWYTRSAGFRQAEAARQAGDRQADALLETVRMTLREQAAVRVLDIRRQTYVAFLGAAESRIRAERTGRGPGDDDARLESALGEVVLEGPAEVASAARDVVDRLRRHEAPDNLLSAKAAFVSAAQEALDVPPGVR
ncbi:hypothetical protein OG978_38350 [Streptomyces sp. NBC_01591]|uniref:hypothetical protein n=1 Tax=Streptomyces sp. NBC_01591 TaxID=2975888 RepID=UPI002DD7DE42|nr:hypothetical protein [Streptomyces sp. NBC_01591]WSD72724.1 hypothetical protein OG978_38350 [Streptomyces sp. NBC_01591]